MDPLNIVQILANCAQVISNLFPFVEKCRNKRQNELKKAQIQVNIQEIRKLLGQMRRDAQSNNMDELRREIELNEIDLNNSMFTASNFPAMRQLIVDRYEQVMHSSDHYYGDRMIGLMQRIITVMDDVNRQFPMTFPSIRHIGGMRDNNNPSRYEHLLVMRAVYYWPYGNTLYVQTHWNDLLYVNDKIRGRISNLIFRNDISISPLDVLNDERKMG